MENKKKVDLVEEARQLRLQAEDLEKRVKIARGTQRVKRQTGQVIVKPSRGPYYVGDEGPTEELMAAVVAALTDHPMRFVELLEATGARDNRLKGVIQRLQREGVRVVNLGNDQKAIWFIPDDAVLARIERARKLATVRR